MLAVVMQHGEIECVNALEVFSIENVLRSGPMDGLRAEIRAEQAQDRAQDRHAGQPELAALFLKQLDEIFLKQRVQDQARRLGNFRQGMIELLFRANHRIEVLDRRDIGVLRCRRPRDRDQGLTGRVGYQVKMKITGLWHLYSSQIACGYYGRRPRLDPSCKPSSPATPISIHMTGTGMDPRCASLRGAAMWIRVGDDMG